ncbi:hypothetical protein CORC01_13753 [Colletotrichum orchidophilum]|uniref:CorA-like transporter domain-containing protein n=1 Tax=Colletotrichum orchidophilum TaxID=1209926 RepID=A0A1G4AP46_9PEZI|nr:uncharacterized protein CORC01_13753 [Colletotrichum orchidophilum]OHE90944.1 hypothetical protein CORC01_13753 [Colletotrichum orchidophilum]
MPPPTELPTQTEVPPEFRDSYLGSDNYPLNHVRASSYGRASLLDQRNRLIDRGETLFVSDEKAKIPIRDITGAGGVRKNNVLNDGHLKELLGELTVPNPRNLDLSPRVLAFKRDEKCRFVFLIAENALAPLEARPEMLMRLLTFYQVMPQFLDFLYIYGSPHGEDKNLRFSGFRTEKVLINPAPGTCIPDMGRSGRRFQICYNLKTVGLKFEQPGQEVNKVWKIRQAAIHHQFDVGSGVQNWILGDPHAVVKGLIQELFPEKRNHSSRFGTTEQSLLSSLEVHLVLARWATSGWRWNVQSLEEIIDNLTLKIISIQKSNLETLDSESLGIVQEWEDKTNETIMVMESNADILTMLRKFYMELVKDQNFPSSELQAGTQAVNDFASQLNEMIYDTQMQISRAQVLVKIVADRKAILIQHMQAQAALGASKLTASMYDQADRSAIEAVAMRIVTVVTLIYLPATFSSTFFSTNVVKYQDGVKFSGVAFERFLQVTIPLMFVTFLLAGVWFWWELQRRRRSSMATRSANPDAFPLYEVVSGKESR